MSQIIMRYTLNLNNEKILYIVPSLYNAYFNNEVVYLDRIKNGLDHALYEWESSNHIAV